MPTRQVLFAFLLGATLTTARAAPASCTPGPVSVMPVIQYDALRAENEVIRVTVTVTCDTKQARYKIFLDVPGTQVRLQRGNSILYASVRGAAGMDGSVTFGGDNTAGAQGARKYQHVIEFQVEPGQWGSAAGTYTIALPLSVTTL